MTIKIFIATEPKTELPYKVLAYSLQKYTKAELELIPMMGIDWTIRPNSYLGTGFSLLRWDIPRQCQYKGYAIYLDVDILCLSDIQELYRVDIDYPNDQSSVWCTYQKHKWFSGETAETSVMFIDCARAKENQPDLEHSEDYIKNDPKPRSRERYAKIMRAMKHQHAPQRIPNKFNRLNSLKENGENVLIHYTKEPQQPWYFPKHPYRNIWEEHLKECIDVGLITNDQIREQVNAFLPHGKGKRGQGLHPYYRKYC